VLVVVRSCVEAGWQTAALSGRVGLVLLLPDAGYLNTGQCLGLKTPARSAREEPERPPEVHGGIRHPQRERTPHQQPFRHRTDPTSEGIMPGLDGPSKSGRRARLTPRRSG